MARGLRSSSANGGRFRHLVREQATPAPITLSPREREIARMISRDLPNESIA
ncbi:MAG TPA: hypothetical protein VHX44_18270 [Planctomycetota bacterium]|nr:hypothetical protein [Planctomycetota bacterium]